MNNEKTESLDSLSYVDFYWCRSWTAERWFEYIYTVFFVKFAPCWAWNKNRSIYSKRRHHVFCVEYVYQYIFEFAIVLPGIAWHFMCNMYRRTRCYAGDTRTMGLLPDITHNCWLRMCRECWERFPRHRLQWKLLVSDPGMHHGTCVKHVPWCW